MLTIQQIKTAHSKVKSGADFTPYIKEIKQLGISDYETFVSDGHTVYYGKDNYEISTGEKYGTLTVTEISNTNQFKKNLEAQQNGETDYPTFCTDCAKSGIEKWIVKMNEMTCTYYDKGGNEILQERVPTV